MFRFWCLSWCRGAMSNAIRVRKSYTRVSGSGMTEKMRIASTGNVGIGTASPDQALTVAGQVHSTSVNSFIR